MKNRVRSQKNTWSIMEAGMGAKENAQRQVSPAVAVEGRPNKQKDLRAVRESAGAERMRKAARVYVAISLSSTQRLSSFPSPIWVTLDQAF